MQRDERFGASSEGHTSFRAASASLLRLIHANLGSTMLLFANEQINVRVNGLVAAEEAEESLGTHPEQQSCVQDKPADRLELCRGCMR